MYSSQLLKGTFQTIILNMLAERGRMYGYEISQLVRAQSDGEILLPEGSLYPILHKMAEEGIVRTEQVQIGKRVRRYYSLTPKGQQHAVSSVEEFKRFVRTMQHLLSSKTALS